MIQSYVINCHLKNLARKPLVNFGLWNQCNAINSVHLVNKNQCTGEIWLLPQKNQNLDHHADVCITVFQCIPFAIQRSLTNTMQAKSILNGTTCIRLRMLYNYDVSQPHLKAINAWEESKCWTKTYTTNIMQICCR